MNDEVTIVPGNQPDFQESRIAFRSHDHDEELVLRKEPKSIP